MQSQDVFYIEEKRYAGNRLSLILVITFFNFVFLEQIDGEATSNIFLMSLALGSHASVSVVYYLYITSKPYALISLRKSILIILDLAVLTFAFYIMEEYSIFLFPLYVIIVMQSGFILGLNYFYISIVLATFSWLILLWYSEYWYSHYDIIATFAITTFLIPFFYLNNIIDMNERNDKLKQELSTIAYDANYDSLTGIGNRKTYRTKLKSLFKTREFFALLFIDLNKFKEINDKYGHHFGDEVLKEVARLLSAQLDEDDFVARLGGDEFVILTQKKKIFLPKFLEKLEKGTIGEYEIEGEEVQVVLSIGISMCPDDHKDEVMLGKYADEAMYRAKEIPNKYHVFYNDIKEVSTSKDRL